MPLPVAANIARVTMTFTDTSGNEAVNVQHFRRSDGISSALQLGALLSAIEAWLIGFWKEVASGNWTATRLEAVDLSVDDSFYVDRIVSVSGVLVSGSMPNDDTVAISLRSVYSGRSRRGRLYHVGLAEGQQDGGQLSPTAEVDLIDAYNELRGEVDAPGWDWGVLSYYSDGELRVTPLYTPYTSIILTDRTVDSMKTRKPRN